MKALDNWRNIGCLICGDPESSTVFPGSWDELGQNNLGFYFSSSRQRAVYGPIVRCTECGFVYANPQPSATELERIYRRLEDHAYASEESARMDTMKRVLDVVERWCPQRGMLLDVGCSTGVFLQCARQRGWKISGVEPSSWALDQCLRRSIPVYQGVIESIALAPESFDAVTLWDVLEHAVDPRAALESIRHTLKRDGLLFINVPDIESVTARLLGSRWQLLLLEHLWYFSSSTLGRLLEECGFQLLTTLPHRVTFSTRFVLTRLIQQGILPRALSDKINSLEWLNRWHISFTMGEMTAVARKMRTNALGSRQ